MPLSKNVLSHIYLLIVALIYGANYSISKWVMDDQHIDPLAFIFFRVLIASALFGIVGFFYPEKIQKKDYKTLVLGGIFGVWINQTFFFYGLHLGSEVHAALLMLATPVLVLVIAFAVIREQITWIKVVGILLGLGGAWSLISHTGDSANQGSIVGDLLVFINALSYAVYLVLVKKVSDKYHPVTITKWVFFFGALFAVPTGLPSALKVQWSDFSVNVWLSFSYVILFTTFLAYLLNAFALQQLSASVVSIYIYFQPLIAIFISLVTGREHLTDITVIAGSCIFMGVFLVSHFEQWKKGVSLRKS